MDDGLRKILVGAGLDRIIGGRKKETPPKSLVKAPPPEAAPISETAQITLNRLLNEGYIVFADEYDDDQLADVRNQQLRALTDMETATIPQGVALVEANPDLFAAVDDMRAADEAKRKAEEEAAEALEAARVSYAANRRRRNADVGLEDDDSKEGEGRSGGFSKQSGFIRRMMAENTVAHKGQYKNEPYNKFFHPKSTMDKKVPFSLTKLTNKSQSPAGKNPSAYGASPFILKHFGTVQGAPFSRKKGSPYPTEPFTKPRVRGNKKEVAPEAVQQYSEPIGSPELEHLELSRPPKAKKTAKPYTGPPRDAGEAIERAMAPFYAAQPADKKAEQEANIAYRKEMGDYIELRAKRIGPYAYSDDKSLQSIRDMIGRIADLSPAGGRPSIPGVRNSRDALQDELLRVYEKKNPFPPLPPILQAKKGKNTNA